MHYQPSSCIDGVHRQGGEVWILGDEGLPHATSLSSQIRDVVRGMRVPHPEKRHTVHVLSAARDLDHGSVEAEWEGRGSAMPIGQAKDAAEPFAAFVVLPPSQATACSC